MIKNKRRGLLPRFLLALLEAEKLKSFLWRYLGA